MLKIGDKTFLNLQEAVAWLMENNCIPFQCTAPYAANTEIGMGTIVNPSPAKVRIGSIIFFSDSKVSTVTGITQNGFIVSDEYNDLVDDVVYVSNVEINASGHLIVTLSNDEQIDAGLIKQVTGFSIDGSQHLIANYNDGTSTDLGAIFNGYITITTLHANTLTATEAKIYETIEDSAGHKRFADGAGTVGTAIGDYLDNVSYCRWTLSGSHLMIVMAGKMKRNQTIPAYTNMAKYAIPSWIRSKIYNLYGNNNDGIIGSVGINKFTDSLSDLGTSRGYVISSGELLIQTLESITVPDQDNVYFRVAYDLIIDDA